jgi:hypothetical protein
MVCRLYVCFAAFDFFFFFSAVQVESTKREEGGLWTGLLIGCCRVSTVL